MPKAALVIGGVSEKGQIQGLRDGSSLIIATPAAARSHRSPLHRPPSHQDAGPRRSRPHARYGLSSGHSPHPCPVAQNSPDVVFFATLEQSVAGLVHEYMRDPVRVALGSVVEAQRKAWNSKLTKCVSAKSSTFCASFSTRKRDRLSFSPAPSAALSGSLRN